MSAPSRGPPPASPPPAAGRARVKEQIRIIVEDLELVLGDLKDVARELKEVVDQIDTLTSDLQLEEEMTDSSRTDTLNSSSSGTTASSLEKTKERARAPAPACAVLTVLRKPNPPPPPPRLTPVRGAPPAGGDPAARPARPRGAPNGDACGLPGGAADPAPGADRCPQAAPRERVRFSEDVQYHGCCPGCDARRTRREREGRAPCAPTPLPAPGRTPPPCAPRAPRAPTPPGRTPPPGPSLPRPPAAQPPPFPLENGGRFPPPRPAALPPPAPPPHKTILRKSTTTTV
ncbi:protein Largen [Dipodomys spectabilis]|uniref:protein Largen n=1 Tax=Dipodomys spectabilis TaxID=105255 RepID=UPI001C5433E7|nr:protein Largen [Dipodomys spectabilis]